MLDKACISTLSFERVGIKMAFSTFKGSQAGWKEALEAGLRTNAFNTGQSRYLGWVEVLACLLSGFRDAVDMNITCIKFEFWFLFPELP